MPTLDPATGRELSDSAIQRVLFVNNDVHVYQIPPITSNKGFAAGSWTDPTKPMAQQIFTARLRVFETSVNGKIKADIVLEDGKTGDLFAAAPYTSTAVVQPANDSSRFFAIRVQGEGGMKATLGIGFEDRSPAFDFGIALSEVRKVLGMNDNAVGSSSARGNSTKASTVQELKQDFSLKEGEKIHILVGSRGRRNAPENTTAATPDDGAALFSIAPPPPPGGKAQTIAPPPSAKSTQESGFDDDFGEFQ
uniref:Related to adaptin ear-binding coat-associated protein 1 n=1 Tax=Ramularia collo-cygni TaxID=112498 RepID=A0A2D3V6H7_9PEZI